MVLQARPGPSPGGAESSGWECLGSAGRSEPFRPRYTVGRCRRTQRHASGQAIGR
jgi:hypothetical protein